MAGFQALPFPAQVWAHSVCSLSSLCEALGNSDITAIETDIVMSAARPLQPIMAHPPAKSSDLTFEDFLDQVLSSRKHIKLDFKEIEAAIACAPLLRAAMPTLVANGQHVWLNADVLFGPGSWDGSKQPLDPETFFAALHDVYVSFPTHCHWSLGWKVELARATKYTTEDANVMHTLLHKYSIERAVFPVCARLAARDMQPLLYLLNLLPQSQLLFWSGAGEPPLPLGDYQTLQSVVSEYNIHSRVGYDVRVCGSTVSSAVVNVSMMIYTGVHWLMEQVSSKARRLSVSTM